MGSVRFKQGEQRKFLKKVLDNLSCPSLRELINRGIDVPYSTLKNYFVEERNLPKKLFLDLCYMAEIDSKKMNAKYLKKNWGQIKGGKISKNGPIRNRT